MIPLIYGGGLAALFLGALCQRGTGYTDFVPYYWEAAVIGVLFGLSCCRFAGAIVARTLLFVPSWLLILTVLQGKPHPIPFYVSFVVAAAMALIIVGFSKYLAEREPQGRNP